MNNKRREKISDLMEELSNLKDRLETIREEEDDARDNMPESLQNSERYEQSEEASESMESAEEALQEAIGYLESVAEDSRFADYGLHHARTYTISPSVSVRACPALPCTAYASRCRPSCKIFFAALISRSWIAPQEGQIHSRTDKSFVPGHCAPQVEHS